MKFFAIFAAAALAFAPALFSAEAVKIDGKYYMEDAGGNLIRLPEGAVPERSEEHTSELQSPS